MPTTIPMSVVIVTTLRHIVPSTIHFIFRLALALSLWLYVMPLVTCCLYRIWLLKSIKLRKFTSQYDEIVSGLIIAAVVALSFIVIMSFIDFLRNHWDIRNDHRMNAPLNNRRRPRAARAAARAPVRAPALVDADNDANPGDGNAIVDPPLNAQAVPNEVDMDAAEAENILNAFDENDGEMQMAVDELLGIRGPWYAPFRNVLWLLFFNAIYLGVFAYIPYCIGKTSQQTFMYFSEPTLQNITRLYVKKEYSDYLAAYLELSNESKNDLQFPVILTISVGIGLTATVSLVLGWILNQVHSTIPRIFITRYMFAYNNITMVIKVGLLLFHRIFVLPIVLGTYLTYVLM
jgi:hypothetical protein